MALGKVVKLYGNWLQYSIWNGWHCLLLTSGCSEEVEWYLTVDSPKTNPGDSLRFGGEGKADRWKISQQKNNKCVKKLFTYLSHYIC